MELVSCFKEHLDDLSDHNNIVRVIGTVLFEANTNKIHSDQDIMTMIFTLLSGDTIDLEVFLSKLSTKDHDRLLRKLKEGPDVIVMDNIGEFGLHLSDPEKYKRTVITTNAKEDPVRQKIAVNAIVQLLVEIVRTGMPETYPVMVDIIVKVVIYNVGLSRATLFKSLITRDHLSFRDALTSAFSLDILKIILTELKGEWKDYISIPKKMEN